MSFLKQLSDKYKITAEIDKTKLDVIVKDVEKQYHDEYDCDSDQDGYFRCSKDRDQILEDDYSDKLSDEELAYCSDQLDALREKEENRNR